MYLLDTNVVLEMLLEQDRADEVQTFVSNAQPHSLCVSEFTLYSLGIILVRRKSYDTFGEMLEDLLATGRLQLLRLGPDDMPEVAGAAKKFALDFDDAYQYVTAQKYELDLVSFDSDFDRTDIRRRLPAEVPAGG